MTPDKIVDIAALAAVLRDSAEAFRNHDIYTQDGNAVRLIAQGDECDQAATALPELLAEYARHFADAIEAGEPFKDKT